MCVHKIAMAAAAFCTFGLFAAGAGSWPPASPSRQFAADKPEVQANPGLARDREQPRPGERARQLRRQLAQYVSIEAIEANTPLETAVRSLSKKFKIPLEIDGKAFQAVGLQ